MEGSLQLPLVYSPEHACWGPADNDALSLRSRLHNACLHGNVAVKGGSFVTRLKRSKGKWTCTTLAGKSHSAKKVVSAQLAAAEHT